MRCRCALASTAFSRICAAAEAQGIEPTVLRLPGIALDIDNPEDLAAFALQPSPTRTRAFLAENAMLAALGARRDASVGEFCE